MTVVGKIMIFFVFIFCLVAGGLMIVVYSTSRNYADAYTKACERLDAVGKDRDQYAAEAKRLKEELAAKEQAHQTQLDAEKQKVDTANAALAREKAAKEALEGTLAKLGAAVDKTQLSSTAKGGEIAVLQKQVVDLNSIIRTQLDDLDKERDERVRAEIERKTYQQRNLELEEQFKEMARDLARARNQGTTGVATVKKPGQGNPPPDNVEGKIRSMQPDGSLLTLTVGSDAGLAEGHTLEVFRLGPNPKYLGTVEILSVRPHEAVARPTKKGMPIQVNDRVASKIQIGGQ